MKVRILFLCRQAKAIKTAGQTTPAVDLSDKTTQHDLLEKTKAVLPAKWNITSTHAGGLPEGWISKDRRTVYCIEAAGPEGTAKFGLFQPIGSAYCNHQTISTQLGLAVLDHVLSDGTYKIMGQGEMPFINTSFWKILKGAHTACLMIKPALIWTCKYSKVSWLQQRRRLSNS